MKKIIAAMSIAALMAAPAFARKVTVEYTSADGDVNVLVFDETAMTVTSGDITTAFTMDFEAKTTCGQAPDGEICITYDELPETPTVGFTTNYTTNTGGSGVAVITAVEE